MAHDEDFDWIETGVRTFFRDVDGTDLSTGFYVVHEVLVPRAALDIDDPDDNTVLPDTVVILRRADGTTHEVFASEIRRLPDDDEIRAHFGLDPSFQYTQEDLDEYRRAFFLSEDSNEELLTSVATTLKEFIAFTDEMARTGAIDGAIDPSATVDRANGLLAQLRQRGYGVGEPNRSGVHCAP